MLYRPCTPRILKRTKNLYMLTETLVCISEADLHDIMENSLIS